MDGTITTNGFSFDQPTMEGLIKNWMELVDSYNQSLNANVSRMTVVEGPGLDYASRSHAEVANRSGEAYSTYLTECRDYCLTQAQQFQNALDDYLGLEHRNVEELHRANSGATDAPPSPESGEI
jgi:hypothetical protein